MISKVLYIGLYQGIHLNDFKVDDFVSISQIIFFIKIIYFNNLYMSIKYIKIINIIKIQRHFNIFLGPSQYPEFHLLETKGVLYYIKGPFRLVYFRAYIKQFMQINKFLCIIYKFLRLFMKK